MWKISSKHCTKWLSASTEHRNSQCNSMRSYVYLEKNNPYRYKFYLSRSTTPPTIWHRRPAKTDQSGHLPIWSESSLCAQWVVRTLGIVMRTAKIRCPGWSVITGGTGHFVGFVVLWLISECSNIFEPQHDKTNKMTCLGKTQISHHVRAVWSESSLCAQ